MVEGASLLVETRFTWHSCKPVDLRVWNYAPSPRGRGWRGTWRETRRNGPEAMGEGWFGVIAKPEQSTE